MIFSSEKIRLDRCVTGDHVVSVFAGIYTATVASWTTG